MSTSQYVLNLGLLAVILGGNLGTPNHDASPADPAPGARRDRRLRISARRSYPGNDAYLEIAGALAGVLLGVAAAMLVRVRRDRERVLATAGAAFAALWVAVIGGRILFAYGATHWFAREIGTFSVQHRIVGAGAWTAAFVLMALAMVAVRVAIGAVQRTRALRGTATVA
ncbi:MAG: hypothetical protein E6F99_20760 [Actinobacteria bacterium]|nr:MAG: hypothetical protein E6F99_20760 [Actinomycetota bacterium]